MGEVAGDGLEHAWRLGQGAGMISRISPIGRIRLTAGGTLDATRREISPENTILHHRRAAVLYPAGTPM